MQLHIIDKNKIITSNVHIKYFATLEELTNSNEYDPNYDIVFLHIGEINSNIVSPQNIQDQCGNLNINIERLVCFSRNSDNNCLWDCFVRKIDYKTNICFEREAEVVLDKFQYHLMEGRVKNFLRRTMFSVASEETRFSDAFEELNKMVVSETINLTIMHEKSFMDAHDFVIFQKDLDNYKAKIIFELANLDFEIIFETIKFIPSLRFWRKVLNTNKKYIFCIAPWVTQKQLRRLGYNNVKHKNIMLWNPILESVEKVKKFLYKDVGDNGIDYTFDTHQLKSMLLDSINLEKNNYIEPYSKIENYTKKSVDYMIFLSVFENLIEQREKEDQDLDPLLFYLGLDIVGQQFNQHTHDFNGKVSINDKDYLQKSKYYQLIQDASDIQFSIDTIHQKLRPEGKFQNIVIIDDNDNQTDFFNRKIKFEELFNAFTNKEYAKNNFNFINPLTIPITINGSKTLLGYLSNYSTINIVNFTERNNLESNQSLEDIKEADVILVDLLYKRSRTIYSTVDEGIKLLSGLNRFIRDHKVRNELTPILAMSHDDNSTIIIEAIKAGAKDYIVKSRMLNLPGIVYKAESTAGEKTTTYHRNFKNLYTLKNEVIGLLQKRKIPVLIEAKDMKNQNYKNYEKLLKVIPKTDLHVHVGSCMTPEFIVLSSFITLIKNKNTILIKLRRVIKYFHKLIKDNDTPTNLEWNGISCEFKTGRFWADNLGKKFKIEIVKKIDELYGSIEEKKQKKLSEQEKGRLEKAEKDLSVIRSKLFKVFKIPDYLDKSKLLRKVESISNFTIAFHLIKSKFSKININEFDWVRIYLLVLATKYKKAKICYGKIDCLDSFRSDAKHPDCSILDELRAMFYSDSGTFSVKSFRGRGWEAPTKDEYKIKVILENESAVLNFDKYPIDYILATGTRSSNLVEYLKGFDYTGSQHLKHPFLIHMYARQVLSRFIEYGVSYAELRGSPNGYKNLAIGFDFTDVINCYVTAFNQSQEEVFHVFKKIKTLEELKVWDVLDSIKNIGEFNKSDWRSNRMPCKVNLLIAGKRHKPISQMILDAAAAASLRKAVNNNSETASDFVKNRLLKSEVAGFDLSGKEDGFPPELFVEEFSRLSKLHIPLTIHAGENASSEFIENAILQLGASRIGHGLSLAQDKQLIDRVIEERVCIELCPVGNHQTSHFTKKGEGGRVYPLEDYLKAGVLVSINTDNPTVSDTNIVKEYFKASKTMPNQLSIWEALRIMRMGYVSAFMSLSDRKYMLELIDQYLYDLFSDKKVIDLLYELD